LEPITPPISPPPSFDSQLKNAGISLRNPRYPELLREPVGFARETDWRASLFSLAARFAVAAGVVALVALIFFLMVPASRQTDTASPHQPLPKSRDRRKLIRLHPAKATSHRSPRLISLRPCSQQPRLASLLPKSSPSRCCRVLSNGVKKIIRPKQPHPRRSIPSSGSVKRVELFARPTTIRTCG
jgi:hypothetical protein